MRPALSRRVNAVAEPAVTAWIGFMKTCRRRRLGPSPEQPPGLRPYMPPSHPAHDPLRTSLSRGGHGS